MSDIGKRLNRKASADFDPDEVLEKPVSHSRLEPALYESYQENNVYRRLDHAEKVGRTMTFSDVADNVKLGAAIHHSKLTPESITSGSRLIADFEK